MKKVTLAFLAGMAFFLFLGFTRDWDEANPTDSTVANQIDEYNRYLRVDVSDRIKNMVYGFTAGETTEGFKYLQFYEQSSVSQPSAAYGRLYGKAVGGKCEMHWQDEDGDEIALTSGGKLNGAVLLAASVPSGSYGADSIDSADYAAGSIDAEHLAADIVDETKIADNGIDSEHYNDGSVDAVHLANVDPDSYSGGETTTFVNGLIIKMGADVSINADSTATVSFSTAFPNAIVTAVVSYSGAIPGSTTLGLSVQSKTASQIVVENEAATSETFNWIAIGY